MVDLMFKAADRAAWGAFTAEVGLTDDGNPNGCLIDEIGPIVVTPAVINPDGSILTPAVLDNSHHVNVRLTQIAGPLPDPLPDDYVQQGHDPAVLAAGCTHVSWVDPATVDNPRRIWAGGMNYWMPEETPS